MHCRSAERSSVFLLAILSFRLMGPPLRLLESPSLSLFLLNTHTPGWMTSLFRPGFLYDRGISRILQQTSPDRWCSRTLSLALSLSLTRSPQHDALCTEHSSHLEVGGARSLTFTRGDIYVKRRRSALVLRG